MLLVQRIQELSGLVILDKLYMSITEHHVFLLMFKINFYNNIKPMWSNFDFLKNRCWYQNVLSKSYSLILLITFMNFKTNSPLKYKLNKYSTSVIFFLQNSIEQILLSCNVKLGQMRLLIGILVCWKWSSKGEIRLLIQWFPKWQINTILWNIHYPDNATYLKKKIHWSRTPEYMR